MRHRLVRLASIVTSVLVLTGCAAAAPPPDAYQQLVTSSQTTWDPIQVNVGMTVRIGGRTVTLDPKDMAVVVDVGGSRGALHVAVSAAALGLPTSDLDAIGLDHGNLAFDALYAGDALYLKSGLLAPSLRMFLGPVGKLPPGDLSGWLKFGTKDELAALGTMLAAGKAPSPAPLPSDPVAARKAILENAGITLAIVGLEKHNGADLERIKIAIDTAKLASSPDFLAGAGASSNGQAQAAAAMVKALSLAGDLWLDPASHRLVEADVHFAEANDATRSGDITVTAHDPDGSVGLDAPVSSVDVPIGPLFTEMMKVVSKSTES